MKTILSAALALAIQTVAAAQANPDLAGTWAFDAGKSTEPSASATARAWAGTRGAAVPPAARLTITERANAVSISFGAPGVTFKLDGTEAFWFQSGENRGTGGWVGGTFVVTWKRVFYAGPKQGYVTFSGKDVYSVTGGELTVEKTTKGPDGTETRKFVYTRS